MSPKIMLFCFLLLLSILSTTRSKRRNIYTIQRYGHLGNAHEKHTRLNHTNEHKRHVHIPNIPGYGFGLGLGISQSFNGMSHAFGLGLGLGSRFGL